MLKTNIQKFIQEGKKTFKRHCFGFTGENLSAYLSWAFSRDYLILSLDKNGINGLAVAYPLPAAYSGDMVQLLPFDQEVTDENTSQLCILDWYATNAEGRISLVEQFFKRYKNWENQEKYGIQNGVIKKLSNKYIKLLTLKY